jgi:hypothetical protein
MSLSVQTSIEVSSATPANNILNKNKWPNIFLKKHNNDKKIRKENLSPAQPVLLGWYGARRAGEATLSACRSYAQIRGCFRANGRGTWTRLEVIVSFPPNLLPLPNGQRRKRWRTTGQQGAAVCHWSSQLQSIGPRRKFDMLSNSHVYFFLSQISLLHLILNYCCHWIFWLHLIIHLIQNINSH